MSCFLISHLLPLTLGWNFHQIRPLVSGDHYYLPRMYESIRCLCSISYWKLKVLSKKWNWTVFLRVPHHLELPEKVKKGVPGWSLDLRTRRSDAAFSVKNNGLHLPMLNRSSAFKEVSCGDIGLKSFLPLKVFQTCPGGNSGENPEPIKEIIYPLWTENTWGTSGLLFLTCCHHDLT